MKLGTKNIHLNTILMKKMLLFFAVALMSMTVSAQGFGGQRGQRGGDPRQGFQRMAERLAKDMKLNKDTKEWFIPLYVEYRDTMMSFMRPQRVEDKALESMDDAAVTQLIEKSLQREAAAISVKREYIAKFREHLNEKQVYHAVIGGMRPRGGDQQRQRSNQGEEGGFPGGFPGGGPGGFGGPDF